MLTSTKVAADATIGEVTFAEEKLTQSIERLKPMDAFGAYLSISNRVEDKQIVLLRRVDDDCMEGCPSRRDAVTPPQLEGQPRLDALWNQRGWVAADEMHWYLTMIQNHGNTNATAPLMLDDENEVISFGNWVVGAIETAKASNQSFLVSAACWRNNHWFPIRANVTADEVQVVTSHHDEALVQQFITKAFGTATPIACRSEHTPDARCVSSRLWFPMYGMDFASSRKP